ncbi:MAG: response regulator transcription factor [Oscillospiraceae bacterium]|jgi:two-component system alkaline phosphatase synthesis response regulator PhoP|nr:response regulator transcription factor [Oscillospiraceae bacterium]
MKYVVFAVEDDAALRELYGYSLENEFDCRCFCDGASFFDALAEGVPDIILLDIMLPGDDGFAILSRLKSGKDTARVPVIVVSAKGEEISKVKGLNMGADDYIAKPFGVLELAARIKANLRKSAKKPKRLIAYKDIVVDSSKHKITANGAPIQTTLKEHNLLCLLCENAESVQTREAIFNAVWGDNYMGESRTLDIHIKELRKKLSEAGSQAAIQTIRGVGYMLT